uniref:Uncharacterized protein n=1 Tax=Chlorobium chlorochromatii (strain CaD3) TaxID=340177 RepID=Q3ATU9_CHLCH
MRKLFLLVLLPLVFLLPVNKAFGANLVILEPTDGASVTWRPLVKGSVSGAKHVWVVVRSVENARFYVQPKAAVRKNGSWKTSVFIGKQADTANNRDFEIMAVGNPTEKLSDGMELEDWPSGVVTSNIVRVVRTKMN